MQVVLLRLVTAIFGVTFSKWKKNHTSHVGEDVAWILAIGIATVVDHVSAGILMLSFLYMKSDIASTRSTDNQMRSSQSVPYVRGGSVINRDNFAVSGQLIGQVMNAQGIPLSDGISGMNEVVDTFTELTSSRMS